MGSRRANTTSPGQRLCTGSVSESLSGGDLSVRVGEALACRMEARAQFRPLKFTANVPWREFVFFPVLMIAKGLLCRMKAGAQFRPPKFTASLLWREFARAPFDTGLVSAVFMFCFKVVSCFHGTHRCFRRSDSTDSLCFFALAELISTIINA